MIPSATKTSAFRGCASITSSSNGRRAASVAGSAVKHPGITCAQTRLPKAAESAKPKSKPLPTTALTTRLAAARSRLPRAAAMSVCAAAAKESAMKAPSIQSCMATWCAAAATAPPPKAAKAALAVNTPCNNKVRPKMAAEARSRGSASAMLPAATRAGPTRRVQQAPDTFVATPCRSTTRRATADTHSATVVAMAAPRAPHPSPNTSVISSTAFSVVAAART
mmetsp:Transcript_13453/g.26407  ORF Transcript_13453/g.26407 Transcript_13453/m.26407 type:complete len:223 (+) Transcript_13453:87-755(+)